jgi:hypothetical protein
MKAKHIRHPLFFNSVKVRRIFLTLVCCLLLGVFALVIAVHRDRRPRIYSAVENGNTNALTKYLSSGSNVNTPILYNRYGGDRMAPLLDIAAAHGQLETVDFLLKHGADPNETDSQGRTALQWVLNKGNEVPDELQVKILKAFIAAGADPNRRNSDENGLTPLMSAAFLGELKMVTALLAAGVDANATNKWGADALYFADNSVITHLLIKAGADPNAHPYVETPEQTAERLEHLRVFRLLTNDTSVKH